jgi:hypothetical protein
MLAWLTECLEWLIRYSNSENSFATDPITLTINKRRRPFRPMPQWNHATFLLFRFLISSF